MNDSKVIIGLLILSGLIGLYVGGGLLFFPADLQAQSNIIIGDNTSHFSETRAPGAAIFSASIIILVGIFLTSWRYFSVLLTVLFFFPTGLGGYLA